MSAGPAHLDVKTSWSSHYAASTTPSDGMRAVRVRRLAPLLLHEVTFRSVVDPCLARPRQRRGRSWSAMT